MANKQRWILTYDEQGKKSTKGFWTLSEMFHFIEEAALPRFKAKLVG